MKQLNSATKPPISLLLLSIAVTLAMMIPLTYLLLRTAGGGGISNLFLNAKTGQVFLNSALLAAIVTVLSTLVAVPIAFLTVRTDLPARRFWSVATTLPLVIPSYVGSYAIIAALGPKGSILQNLLEPFGIDRLTSHSPSKSIRS
jgi:iron(III) transport system permease protein